MPARKAPSTASRWNRSVTARAPSSSSIVPRRVIWAVSFCPAADDPASRPPPARCAAAGRGRRRAPPTAHSEARAANRPWRAEEQRDRQHREQLADRARGEQVPAQPAAEQSLLPQDRQQRAESRGGQPQRDRHVRLDHPGGGEHPDHAGRQRQGADPGDQRAPAGVLAQQAQVDLVAGEQEHEAQPDVGEHPDVLRRAERQHVRADDDAAGQQQHHLGHRQPREQPDDDGGQQATAATAARVSIDTTSSTRLSRRPRLSGVLRPSGPDSSQSPGPARSPPGEDRRVDTGRSIAGAPRLESAGIPWTADPELLPFSAAVGSA